VISFFVRRDTRAELYRPHLADRLLIVFFMTVAELDRWAIERNWGAARRANLARYLDGFVMHPSSRGLCRVWAEVMAETRRKGRPMSVADAWQAATARLRGIPLITHNGRDYAGVTGLTVISESAS
jgi:predicted nucleic acid-binding protein